MGKPRRELVVVVVEILRKEEVTVGVIVVGLYGELGGLHAALGDRKSVV